ncbi:uncharacterized protein LOC117173933 [Belonocnema kinseyi]|uniref:uncharacterized protein LOC117173933 n=1 Tax=Belonocnema kinseyi TaxID=2817044 RepID=UPI00143E06FF|nr:uncharacterized protein LOC117173933 [Belonocnema kinseyi]
MIAAADLSLKPSESLNTHNWTDRNTNKSYLGLTVHYPEPSSIKSVELECFPLNESHTSDCLCTQLDNLCQEWNILRSSISSVITDNAANIVKAIHDMFGKSLHLPCLAPTIQLIPELAMEKTQMLQEIVDSAALLKLREGPPMLLPEEIETLKEIMHPFKPIEKGTRELYDDDFTYSKSIPIVICLNAALEKKEPIS